MIWKRRVSAFLCRYYLEDGNDDANDADADDDDDDDDYDCLFEAI